MELYSIWQTRLILIYKLFIAESWRRVTTYQPTRGYQLNILAFCFQKREASEKGTTFLSFHFGEDSKMCFPSSYYYYTLTTKTPPTSPQQTKTFLYRTLLWHFFPPFHQPICFNYSLFLNHHHIHFPSLWTTLNVFTLSFYYHSFSHHHQQNNICLPLYLNLSPLTPPIFTIVHHLNPSLSPPCFISVQHTTPQPPWNFHYSLWT